MGLTTSSDDEAVSAGPTPSRLSADSEGGETTTNGGGGGGGGEGLRQRRVTNQATF